MNLAFESAQLKVEWMQAEALTRGALHVGKAD